MSLGLNFQMSCGVTVGFKNKSKTSSSIATTSPLMILQRLMTIVDSWSQYSVAWDVGSDSRDGCWIVTPQADWSHDVSCLYSRGYQFLFSVGIPATLKEIFRGFPPDICRCSTSINSRPVPFTSFKIYYSLYPSTLYNLSYRQHHAINYKLIFVLN